MIVSICAILHNPNPTYLLEWLEHHRAMGVDHFILWDNDCSPSLKGMMDNRFPTELVTICLSTGWDGGRVQMDAYQQTGKAMLSGNLPYADWIAFIDEDEFLICDGDLKEFLACRPDPLVVSWQVMGSSGGDLNDPRPQMVKFFMGTPEWFPENRHVKSIMSPAKAALHWPTPHATVAGGCDVDGQPVGSSGLSARAIHRGLWVRHFFTRSKEEFAAKVERGRARGRNQALTLEYFYEINQACLPLF